jgi:hypothetical protein
MSRKLLGALLVAASFGAIAFSANADPIIIEPGYGCEIGCKWYQSYDQNGNPNGGYWICPGEEAECVSG